MFKKYKRTNVAEMRQIQPHETLVSLIGDDVSVSQADIDNGSPHPTDMIARNPLSHKDQWLVAEAYFLENFEEIQ